MITTISESAECELRNLCEKANFLSFMMDGSTDIAGDEQETIYVRTTINGKVYTKFLCIGSPQSTCSSDLYEYVLQTFKNLAIDNFIAQGKYMFSLDQRQALHKYHI